MAQQISQCHGCQESTIDLFTQVLRDAGVRISMDGKGALIKALPGLRQVRYTQVASRCPRRLDEVRFQVGDFTYDPVQIPGSISEMV